VVCWLGEKYLFLFIKAEGELARGEWETFGWRDDSFISISVHHEMAGSWYSDALALIFY
jgi:hypothetical protein